MDLLSFLFSVLVTAGLCILAGSLTYGAFFSPEDPRFEDDKIMYRS